MSDAQASVASERQALPSEDRSQGFAIHVQADAGLELKLESLNNSGLSLLAVRPPGQGSPQEAVVWVPDGSVQKLAKKINDFTLDTPHGNPRNAQLVANMKHIERAVLANLWMEADPFPDPDEYRWWELWFDPRTAHGDQVQTLRHVAEAHSWVMAPRSVNIGDFRVAQVAATARDLAAVMATGACPAEIRQPSFVEALLGDQRELQHGFVADLAERLRHPQPGAPTVCLLDTGIHQEHPLLRGALVNAHSEMASEGPEDRRGHGTWMAGVSLFGNGLGNALESREPIVLVHGLESVKILSLSPVDPPRVFGEVTATAMSRVETSSGPPPLARVFAMAVTVPSTARHNGTDGRATLWSTTIDALAVGTDVEARADGVDLVGAPDPQTARLIIVSAGNVVDHPIPAMRGIDGTLSHLALCDTLRIEDPAHAWNVLTVGASTHLVDVPKHRDFAGYRPLATAGELSPFSRTSVAMPEATAIKPDIVLEGGNLLVDAQETHTALHDLVSVMTTGRPIADRVLTSINATSAATAQAARLAALAFAAYPQARPETVRGLLVHEAQWTENMTEGVYARTMRRKMTSGEFARKVLRRYGWGMPTEERVLSSAANAVTMMIQGTLVPFIRGKTSIRLGELNLHQLPWPREQLLELGTAPVQLRVTLSYFIEPNPGRKGVLGTHTYASHRLRFALKAPHQSLAHFENRVAIAAEAENDGITTVAAFESDKNWVVGSDNRNRGSLHADIWHGTATELADCGALAVYPAGGWWKYNNRADRVGTPVNYALLVSLATPEVTADLYTPTAVMLNVPITIEPSARSNGVSIASQLPLEW
ncbi:S8 family peptidase [Streptomyces sp. NPDC005227]|uniref:S8 family peptidase n=1 Tax=Streptomyces sp. NPDC005227 TaxID=3364707 RepID=UPI0036CF5A43